MEAVELTTPARDDPLEGVRRLTVAAEPVRLDDGGAPSPALVALRWGGDGETDGAAMGAGFGGATAEAGFGDAAAEAGFGGATAEAGFGGATTEAGFGGATTEAGFSGATTPIAVERTVAGRGTVAATVRDRSGGAPTLGPGVADNFAVGGTRLVWVGNEACADFSGTFDLANPS